MFTINYTQVLDLKVTKKSRDIQIYKNWRKRLLAAIGLMEAGMGSALRLHQTRDRNQTILLLGLQNSTSTRLDCLSPQAWAEAGWEKRHNN
jgi:hypothetical protein